MQSSLIVELGHYALTLAGFAALLRILVPIAAGRLQHEGLLRMSAPGDGDAAGADLDRVRRADACLHRL